VKSEVKNGKSLVAHFMGDVAVKKRVLIFLARWVLAGLFIYAGAIKILRPDVFFGDVMSYRLLPV
jgi:hypothetical protein